METASSSQKGENEIEIVSQLRTQSEKYEKFLSFYDKLLIELKRMDAEERDDVMSKMRPLIKANQDTLTKALSIVQKTYDTAETIQTMEKKLSEQQSR